jgi:hypothetical protein
VDYPEQDNELQLFSEDPLLERSVHDPWFRAYLKQNVGCSLSQPDKCRTENAYTTLIALARHCLLAGQSGFGKSMLALAILCLLLGKESIVVLDPKAFETARGLLDYAIAAGYAPERIWIIDPRRGMAPGWNPFLSGIPTQQVVAFLVSLIEANSTGWGPRLSFLLNACLTVAGAHKLSIFEAMKLLSDEEFGNAILRRPLPVEETIALKEAVAYLKTRLPLMSKTEKNQAIMPVLTRLNELIIKSDFFFSLLCSEEVTLDLASLWQKPGIVLVHLDQPTLGEAGCALLAGLFCQTLLWTSLRTTGPVQVTLAFEEMATTARMVSSSYVGSLLIEIVTKARSRGLHLLALLQGMAGIPDDLRSTLLSNTAVQIYFRLSASEAKIVGSAIGMGAETRLSKATVSVDQVDKVTGEPKRIEWRQPILSPQGYPQRLKRSAWDRLTQEGLQGKALLNRLETIAHRCGASPLYVLDADTGEAVFLKTYVVNLAPHEYRILGPSLQLGISFIKPRFTALVKQTESDISRGWARRIQTLPVQHAVLRNMDGCVNEIRVVDVSLPVIHPQRRDQFIAQCLKVNGQPLDTLSLFGESPVSFTN